MAQNFLFLASRSLLYPFSINRQSYQFYINSPRDGQLLFSDCYFFKFFTSLSTFEFDCSALYMVK